MSNPSLWLASLSEWLANISIVYVIAGSIVLFIIRMALGKRTSEFAKATAEVTESILIAVVLVFLIIRPFFVQAFFIPSESMIPTLEVSDHILVNKLVYRFEQPHRGDIVVFKSPPEARNDEKDFIKRLIAVPGDTVQVKVEGRDPLDGSRSGTLYLNGREQNEPYLAEPHNIKLDFLSELPEINLEKPYTVPPGKYLMMGDNRNDSHDSRFWGALDRNRIIGKAMFRFWPLNRIGLLH
jgi:signal peptidase I